MPSSRRTDIDGQLICSIYLLGAIIANDIIILVYALTLAPKRNAALRSLAPLLPWLPPWWEAQRGTRGILESRIGVRLLSTCCTCKCTRQMKRVTSVRATT